jgi:hypothetical protein
MDTLINDATYRDNRVIKTARSLAEINEAVQNGFQLLFKRVEPSDKIRTKFKVVRYKDTGVFEVFGDYRENSFEMYHTGEYETVLDWTYYYPYTFSSPYAAYLIPKDIQIGERVFVEDLIEDFVGRIWNQGDTYRLESCEALWNGKDLEIIYDPGEQIISFVG